MQDIPADALSFEVAGLPPVRMEGLSIFSAGHRQATRVRDLLGAACRAAQDRGWTPLTGPVALEVTLRCPPQHRTADAATLLGGVSAVLQDKKRTADIGLGHLGPLADVALFVHDRQLRRLTFHEESAADTSYVVRVAALPQV